MQGLTRVMRREIWPEDQPVSGHNPGEDLKALWFIPITSIHFPPNMLPWHAMAPLQGATVTMNKPYQALSSCSNGAKSENKTL